MLVVTLADECGNCVGTVNGIDYGSTALTFQIRRERSGATPSVIVEVWTLDEAGIAAEGGSAAFTVNWSSGPSNELFSVVTIANVDQSNPVPQAESEGDNQSSITLVPSLVAYENDLVYYAVASRAITNHTPSTSYLELSDLAGNLTLANAYRELTATSSESPTATMGVSGSMVMVGMYFQLTSDHVSASVDGDWDIGTTWGGSCASGCTEGIDFPGSGWIVDIPSTVDITIPSGLNAQCKDIYINSDRGTTAATLTLNDGTSSLQLNNNLFVQASGASTATGTTLLDMNGGDLSVSANLKIHASVTPGILAGSSADSKSAYTPPDETDRLMVVTVGYENANNIGTISNLTWGSTSLTYQIGETRNTDMRVEIWTLDEAGISSETGVQDFTVNWSAGSAAEKFNVVVLYNVDQTTPIDATKASNNTNSSTKQVSPSLSVAANDLYFYATSGRAGNETHTASTGYTESNYQTTAGGWSMANAYKQITAAGSEQPTATWSSLMNLVIAGMVISSSGTRSTQEAMILTDGGNLTVNGDITMFSDGNNVEIDLATTSGSTLVLGGDLVEAGQAVPISFGVSITTVP